MDATDVSLINMASCAQQKQRGVANRRTCQHSQKTDTTNVWRKANRNRIRVYTLWEGSASVLSLWRPARQSTNREIPPRYSTLSRLVFRRSLRMGVTMQDKACAATGKHSALWQSRLRRRNVGRTPKSLARAGSHSPISTSAIAMSTCTLHFKYSSVSQRDMMCAAVTRDYFASRNLPSELRI